MKMLIGGACALGLVACARRLLDWERNSSRHPDAAQALAANPDVVRWSAEHHVC